MIPPTQPTCTTPDLSCATSELCLSIQPMWPAAAVSGGGSSSCCHALPHSIGCRPRRAHRDDLGQDAGLNHLCRRTRRRGAGSSSSSSRRSCQRRWRQAATADRCCTTLTACPVGIARHRTDRCHAHIVRAGTAKQGLGVLAHTACATLPPGPAPVAGVTRERSPGRDKHGVLGLDGTARCDWVARLLLLLLAAAGTVSRGAAALRSQVECCVCSSLPVSCTALLISLCQWLLPARQLLHCLSAHGLDGRLKLLLQLPKVQDPAVNTVPQRQLGCSRRNTQPAVVLKSISIRPACPNSMTWPVWLQLIMLD